MMPSSMYWNVLAYVVMLSDDRLVLAFRGTIKTSCQDWQDDVDVQLTSANVAGCHLCKTHLGFQRSWGVLKSEVMTHLMSALDHSPNVRSVHVTGHSLGGAIATIASYDLQNARLCPTSGSCLSIASVYTFGAPRSINNAFAAHYLKTKVWPMWRFTHWKDPVPHVPLMQMGFHHVGTEVFLGQCKKTPDGSFEPVRILGFGDGSGEDSRCSNAVMNGLPHVSDHTDYFCHNAIIIPPAPASPPSLHSASSANSANTIRQKIMLE